MNWNIVNLCLNTPPLKLIHKLSARDTDFLKINEENVEVEITIRITQLNGNLNRFNTPKGLVIPVNDLAPAFSKFFEFLQLRDAEGALYIRNAIVISRIHLLIVPRIH